MSIHIQKYTDKSIVLRGDTQSRSEEIKALGGKFGYFGGQAGWVFPLVKEQVVRDALNIRSPYVDGPARVVNNQPPPQQIPQGVISIEYSNDTIILRGDTKPRSSEIKALGGKFGYFGGQAGWVFPLTKEQFVRDTLQITSTVSPLFQSSQQSSQEMTFRTVKPVRGALKGSPEEEED